MTDDKKIPVYFKNLDGLRFIAAFFVIIGHCQNIVGEVYQKNKLVVPYQPYANKLAVFGVDFFFVLSGFLIAYMLIEEINKTGTLQVKRFYIRRALRLWPLYFLVGVIGILTANFFINWFNMGYGQGTTRDMLINLLCLFTFTLNFETLFGWMNGGGSLMLGHFWSLGVEEQFYLALAPLLRWAKNKMAWLFLGLIVVGFLSSYFWVELANDILKLDLDATKLNDSFYNFTINRFFYFGLGGLFAWLQHSQKLTPQYPLPKRADYALQLAFVVPTLFFLFRWVFFHGADWFINGLLAVGFVAVAIHPNSIFRLEQAWLKYLGKISFGIYIFHLFAIRLSEKILLSLDIDILSLSYLVMYPLLATFLSVGFAVLSYEFFEKYFLKLKNKFR
ncbi:MAG: acyltransferase [Saprospiraceae bacterium]|nr:acyltransferase [Saprospiraceae bacterium]